MATSTSAKAGERVVYLNGEIIAERGASATIRLLTDAMVGQENG